MLDNRFSNKKNVTTRLMLAFVFAVMTAFAANVSAATFVVNSTTDAQDATPGDGICATAGAVCTLRAAITEANAFAGADTITLPAGTYTHGLVAANENANAGGDYDITSDITINGAGSATTIVQANAASGVATERVFHVVTDGVTVTIDGVTVQNGWAKSAADGQGRGGGIKVAGDSTTSGVGILFTLTNSVVQNNRADTRGGGLAINKGNLVVTGCTFTGNNAGDPSQTVAGGAGGAMIIDAADNGAAASQTAVITNTVMSNNKAETALASSFGGAVIVRAVGATVTFNGCTITNNSSIATPPQATNRGFAGGLYNQNANMIVTNSTVSGNTSSDFHAGIRILNSPITAAADTTLDIINSTVSNNTALGSNGGSGQGGGISQLTAATGLNSAVNIDHSTISGNVAAGDAGIAGGILNTSGGGTSTSLLNVINSTISGNTAADVGGIYSDGATCTSLFDFTTVANNSATGISPSGDGGGLYQDTTAGGSSFISNSIFADNIALTNIDISGTPAGLVTSLDYNHVEAPGTGFVPLANDVTGTDPSLGILVNNGGPTNTHLPGAGSVVLNTIPNATNGCGAPVNDDQRGSARPFPAAGACDKGAVERQAAEAGTPTSTSTFTPTATFTPTNTPASTATNTATATATFTPTPVTCPITVLPSDGSTSGNARAPSTRFAASRAHYLITAAELAAAGYTAGAIPGTIGWNYAAAPVTSGSAPLKIYMENTADTTNLKSATWATAISTMTTVHNATTLLPGTAGPFDITLTGATSFTYTGGGLYIAYDWGSYAGTLSTTSVIATESSLANSLFGANSAAATVSPSAFRPETRLNGLPPVNNDVEVGGVYTYGELPLGAVSGHAVRALVTNNSSGVLTNVPVTLNITGANTFSDTQVVASLAACGGSAVVTFAGFTPASLGSNTVAVSVPADDNNTNNAQSKTQNVTALEYSYKHPASTASGGVGFNGATGAVVGKFTTNSPRSITDVKLEFNTAGATAYRVVIYGDAGGGTPALTTLYEDASDRTVAVAGPVTITLPAPVAVPAGDFFVGVHQTNTTNLSLSYDDETPLRTGSFFEGSPLPPTAFNDLAGSPFKLNIGLILAAAATPTATNTPTPSGTASVGGTVTYGNPASPTLKFISNATVASTVGSPFVSTTTAAPGGTAGQYTLTGFGAGNYTIGVTKTTGQNGISSADAARIAQHVAGTSLIPTSRQRIAADVTNNGALSSTDAAQIARFVSGLGAPIGLTSQWRFFVPSVTEPTFPIGASPTTRSYTDPIGVQTGQDYIGILVGETTGNWAAGPLRPAAGPERKTAIAAPSLVTPADGEVIIPVSVNGAENKGILSYEFELRYDPTVIQPQAEAVELAGTVSRGLTAVANPNEPGLLIVVVYGAYPIDTNGLLLNLKFTAVGAPGSVSPLTWERVMFNEGDPGTLSTDGTVELSASAPNQAELTGRVVNTMGQGMANARVTLTDTTTGAVRSVMSNGFGAYRFGGLTVGQTYTISVDSKNSTFAPLTVSITGQSVNTDMIAAQ